MDGLPGMLPFSGMPKPGNLMNGMGFGHPMGSAGSPLGTGFAGSDPLGMGATMAFGQQQSAMMEQMFSVMSTVLNMMMLKALQGLVSGSPNFGGGATGAGGEASGLGSFLGGGGSAASDVSNSSSATNAPNGSGEKAAEIAKKYLGRKSGEINDMANFTHAGGMTNNCADFVSACLANAGMYKKKPGDASVRILKQHLKEDGWRTVSKAQAKPGDVAIFNGSQHIELVVAKGGTQLIGSNNKGNSSTQTVSTDSGTWGSVEYLSKG